MGFSSCFAFVILAVRLGQVLSSPCGTGVPWAVCVRSPNCNERKFPINIVVLHYTQTYESRSLSILTDPKKGVSSNYLITENGTTYQLVDEAERSWHAGWALWKEQGDINSRSIGIEIVNYNDTKGHVLPYPDEQIDAVIRLCSDIKKRYVIKSEDFIGHSDVAPLRKIDPGEHFPWKTLHEAGIGHWVPPFAIKADDHGLQFGSTDEIVLQVQKQLMFYGYGYVNTTGVYDNNTMAVVAAFQRHFRPERVDGRADQSTIDTLTKLIAELPNNNKAASLHQPTTMLLLLLIIALIITM